MKTRGTLLFCFAILALLFVLPAFPAGVDCVFIRVDQNKLWWIRGDETGHVDIWE